MAFAFVTSITPGPNNLMLMASGANFGLRRTVPHMLGVGLGFGFMICCVGLGLAGLFELVPAARLMLATRCRWATCSGWPGASPTRPRPSLGRRRRRPFTFLQAAAFQWVNPKAWTMALSALSPSTRPGRSGASSQHRWYATVFAAINLP